MLSLHKLRENPQCQFSLCPAITGLSAPSSAPQVRLWEDMWLVGPGVAQVNGISPPTCSALF